MSWQDDDGTQSQIFGPVFVPGKQIPGNSWDAVLPTNPPRAKAALLVAAMPFFFMALGTELDVSAEEMGWQPVYPDTVDRVETHPAHAPYYFAELTETLPAPPTGPGDAAIWLPIYDDNLPHWDRRLGMIPFGSLEGSLGAPLANGSAFYGPDFVLPLARGPHASLAPFFFMDPEPIAAPVFDPTTNPRGTYPDQLPQWTPTSQHASQFPFFFYEGEPTDLPPEAEQMAWLPVYPDAVDRRTTHPSAMPSVFYEADPSVTELGWLPVYPDLIDPPVGLHVSAMPSTFFVGEPRDVDATAELAWRPTYPDQIDRLQTHPSSMPSVFYQGDPRDFGFELGSWYPSYPDFATGPRGTHASQQDAYFAPERVPDVPFDPVTLDWIPTYPDAVARASSFPADHQAVFAVFDPKLFPEVLGSWYPTYPDLLDPTPGLHASQQRAFFFNSDPIPTPDIPIPQQNIRPVYPDTIARRPSMHAAPYFFFVEEPTDLPPEAEEMGWSPTYPDQVARRTTHPSDMPSVFHTLEPTGLLPPVLSWEPEYPSQVAGRSTHPSLMPSVFQTITPDDLSWLPAYPDLVPRRAAVQAPYYFAPERDPAPAFDPADLSWSPTYPDAVARATVFPSDAPAVFSVFAPETFDPPLGSWYPTYPDSVKAPVTLHASSQVASFFDPNPVPLVVVPEFVPPVYPDVIHRIQPKGSIFIVDPVLFPNETRITQMPVEVVQVDDAIDIRITQMPIEVTQIDDAIDTRVTQVAIEIVHTGDCPEFSPSVPPPAGNPPPCPPVGPTAVLAHDCPPTGTK